VVEVLAPLGGYFIGRFVLTFDSQGNPTFSSVGQTRDLCAELAG